MSSRHEDFKNPPHRLPDITLVSAADGSVTRIRSRRRRAPIIVYTHGVRCSDCWSYLDRLAERRADIEEWDGNVLVIVPELLRAGEFADRAHTAVFPLLQDPERRLATSIPITGPTIVIADQWAEIRLVESAGPEHRFLSPDEIVDWARFLAIECPECQGEAF